MSQNSHSLIQIIYLALHTECYTTNLEIGFTEHYTHISMEAARQVAGVLETPFMDIQAVVIPAEPERDKLAELVKTLPIQKIQELLAIAQKSIQD